MGDFLRKDPFLIFLMIEKQKSKFLEFLKCNILKHDQLFCESIYKMILIKKKEKKSLVFFHKLCQLEKNILDIFPKIVSKKDQNIDPNFNIFQDLILKQFNF